ncbi:MAG TPA: hypothetical protein PKY88_12555 [Anaerohalosphaeraceae bacterium]|nr:hypothetical protein [Anaerohalosphaeraceae bacterium]
MPLRKVHASVRRRRGLQFLVFECPYCSQKNHLPIGDYNTNPQPHRFVKTICCGSNLELTQTARQGPKTASRRSGCEPPKKAMPHSPRRAC